MSNKTVKIEIGKVEYPKRVGKLRITLSDPLPEEEMRYMMSVLRSRIGCSCTEDPAGTFNALVPFPDSYVTNLVENVFWLNRYHIIVLPLEENPKDDLVTVWVIGGFLDDAKIYELEGTMERGDVFHSPVTGTRYLSDCYYRTQEEALMAAEILRKERIEDLRKEISQYEALTFEIVKMES